VTEREPFAAQNLQASLTVADIGRSLRWYRDVLGFAIDREFERNGRLFAVSLRADQVRLLLTQDDGAKGERAKGEGFSLQLTTAQDIDGLAELARQAGALLDTEPTNARGVRVFRLRDPDGFRLVISSPRD
jgi:catechol 2,3-dioxygenase-like lactoylglutathione lyase family enzyme